MKSDKKLNGKVALIVGGADDDGRSLAIELAQNGADIVIVYFNERHNHALETRRKVRIAGEDCLIIAAQQDNADAAREVVRRIVEHFGHLDIFIDNTDPTQLQQDANQPAVLSNLGMVLAAMDQLVNSPDALNGG